MNNRYFYLNNLFQFALTFSSSISRFPNDGASNEDETPNTAERDGRTIFFLNRAKAAEDTKKVIPDKVKPHPHVVTETIFVTKVQKQHGPTATLVVENCVPINSHIPFCGNIYPIYQVNEAPSPYFQVMPLVGKLPLGFKHNYLQTGVPQGVNLFTPNGSQQPGITGLRPGNSYQGPQIFPPTSLLQSHLPGFINRISNFHGNLHNRIGNIGKFAATVTSSLAQGMQSHFQKGNAVANEKPSVEPTPPGGLELSPNEIVEIGYKSEETGEASKPVKEDSDENVSKETTETENKNLNLKIQPNIENIMKETSNTSDMVKTLNAAIVKQLSEITSSGVTASIHNFTQTSTEPTTLIQQNEQEKIKTE